MDSQKKPPASHFPVAIYGSRSYNSNHRHGQTLLYTRRLKDKHNHNSGQRNSCLQAVRENQESWYSNNQIPLCGGWIALRMWIFRHSWIFWNEAEILQGHRPTAMLADPLWTAPEQVQSHLLSFRLVLPMVNWCCI
jgi:hypothetical protein